MFDHVTDPLARAHAEEVAVSLRAAGRFGADARLGVAYSGGVDSAVLLALAVRTLGRDAVVGILAVSESLARRERAAAHRLAAEIGADIAEITTEEVANPDYAANPVTRCYFCKDEMFARIDDEAAGHLRLAAVAYGENADDARRPDRPGAHAATEHGVLRPLAEAGLTKRDVRAVARGLGLSVADKPAAPCLASRIPHGEPVTAAKLRQIEDAEDALIALGFPEVRVRHHGDAARIEVPSAELPRLMEVREEALAGVRAAGFRSVSVDLAGLQSGAFTLQILGVGSHG